MTDIQYVHVQWTKTGADDMVPQTAAPLLEQAGDLTIVDPTPSRYRRFKPNLPLGEPANPDAAKTRRSRRNAPDSQADTITDSPKAGPEPEEATE